MPNTPSRFQTQPPPSNRNTSTTPSPTTTTSPRNPVYSGGFQTGTGGAVTTGNASVVSGQTGGDVINAELKATGGTQLYVTPEGKPAATTPTGETPKTAQVQYTASQAVADIKTGQQRQEQIVSYMNWAAGVATQIGKQALINTYTQQIQPSPQAKQIAGMSSPLLNTLQQEQTTMALGRFSPEGAYSYYSAMGLGRGQPYEYSKFSTNPLAKAEYGLYSIGQTSYKHNLLSPIETFGKQILSPINIVGQKTNNKFFKTIYSTPEISREVIPQSYNFLSGYVGELRRKPVETGLTTAAFFVLPVGLSAAEYGLVNLGRIAAIKPAVSFTLKAAEVSSPWINRALLGAYSVDVAARTLTSKTPAYTLGAISSTEITPMAAGLKLGARIAFPIQYKTTFEKGLQALPEPKQTRAREEFKFLKLQLAQIKTGKTVPTELNLQNVESGTPKAREITRQFLIQYKKDIIVGGSVSQKFQLSDTSKLRPSGDIDVYGKNLAKQLAKQLRMGGVSARTVGNKVYVTGESGISSKFIEFNPKSKLYQNIATVSNPFVPEYLKLVETPEGIKIPKLEFQAARKLYGGFETETDILGRVSMPRYSKDIPDYRALVSSVPKAEAERLSLPEAFNKMFASKAGRFAIPLNTARDSFIQGLVPAKAGTRGGTYPDYSYPSYPTYNYPRFNYPSYPTKNYPNYSPVLYPSLPAPSYPNLTAPSYPNITPPSYPSYAPVSYPSITPTTYPTLPTLSLPATYPSYPSYTYPSIPSVYPPRSNPDIFLVPKRKEQQINFQFYSGKKEKRKKSRKIKRQKYLPSFAALDLRIFGKPARELTGLEVRPVKKYRGLI